MSTSHRSVDMIFLGLTIDYVYLLTIRHLYKDYQKKKLFILSIYASTSSFVLMCHKVNIRAFIACSAVLLKLLQKQIIEIQKFDLEMEGKGF